MQSKLSKFYMYLFLSFLAGIILVPLYLTFISSFKTLGDLSSNVIGLPREWIFQIIQMFLVWNIFGHLPEFTCIWSLNYSVNFNLCIYGSICIRSY